MKEGINYTMTPKEYFSNGVKPTDQDLRKNPTSKSTLWDFCKNPARWIKGVPKKTTDSMRWGNLVDTLLLTPDRFEDAYLIKPDTYEDAKGEKKPWNANSNTCKAWLLNAAKSGKEVISSKEYDEAQKAVMIAKQNEKFCAMQKESRPQVAMFAECLDKHDRPFFIKGLIDLLPDAESEYGDFIIDLKTTGRLDSVGQIERTILDFGYHVQAALYLDMYNLLSGENRTRFGFWFQLSDPPYDFIWIELHQDAILEGRKWYQDAVTLWCNAIHDGSFPSPFDDLEPVNLPSFYYRQKNRL